MGGSAHTGCIMPDSVVVVSFLLYFTAHLSRFFCDAHDERARRVGRASGATRTSTVIATVLSRLATLRPARPRAQASLPARRRTAVHRAAALGPATSGLIASYERLGYG